MGNMAFFRGGGYRRWLPPEIGSADEAVLVRRCWELLVLDSGGAARLAALGRAPPVPHGADAAGGHRRVAAGAAGGGLRPVAPVQPRCPACRPGRCCACSGR